MSEVTLSEVCAYEAGMSTAQAEIDRMRKALKRTALAAHRAGTQLGHLERENAALREGSDAAGLSALADIREALGVGGRPCLFELAGLVREKVERVRELEAVAVAAKAFVYRDVGAQNPFNRLRGLSVVGYLKEAE